MRYTIVFIYFLLLGACKDATQPSNPLPEMSLTEDLITISEQQFTASDYQLGQPAVSNFNQSLRVTGKIYLPESSKATISTLMPGTIGPMRLHPGQWVRQGQELFRVSNPELINLQQEYLMAKESIHLLKKEYTRQQELAAANITLQKDLIAVETNVRITEVKISALAQKLNLYGIQAEDLSVDKVTSSISIRAPISGYIAHIRVNEGMFLESGVTALKIENTSDLQVHLNVLEKDWRQLEKGQKVRFSVQGNEDEKLQAEVRTIPQMVDEAHMISVYCSIEASAKKSLVQGMFITAEIITAASAGMSLPEEAVVKFDSQHFVLRLVARKDDQLQFEKIPVKEQLRQGGMVNVEEAKLNGEDQFLVKGAYYLVLE